MVRNGENNPCLGRVGGACGLKSRGVRKGDFALRSSRGFYDFLRRQPKKTPPKKKGGYPSLRGRVYQHAWGPVIPGFPFGPLITPRSQPETVLTPDPPNPSNLATFAEMQGATAPGSPRTVL